MAAAEHYNFVPQRAASEIEFKRTYAQATIQDQAATFTLGQRPTSALELTGEWADVRAAHPEDDVLSNVRRMIGDAFQIA